MQKIFMQIILSLFFINTYAQKVEFKTKPTATKPVKLLTGENLKKMPEQAPQGLPDLIITNFSAVFIETMVENGISKHQLQLNYSIKNVGTVKVPTKQIGWQGWVGYESAVPKLIPGGGAALSEPISTGVLQPGQTIQQAFKVTVPYDRTRQSFYTFYVDDFNDVKEINEQNNIAQCVISN